MDDFYVGPFRVDPHGRRLFLADEELALSRLQFDLLLALANPPGRAVSYEELWRAAWGTAAPYNKHSRACVSTGIHRLRVRIGSERIVGLWGFGFRLNFEDDTRRRPFVVGDRVRATERDLSPGRLGVVKAVDAMVAGQGLFVHVVWDEPGLELEPLEGWYARDQADAYLEHVKED